MSNPAGAQTREEMALLWFMRGFLAWFVVYMSLQGMNGFFASTVDRVQTTWVQLVFLNIPLQLFLAFIASWGLTKNRSPSITRFALAVAVVNALLIVVHIGLSVMTAWQAAPRPGL